MKKKLQKENIIPIERYSPTITSGLSSFQVENRIKQGLTNKNEDKYSKSYLSIFVGNICTFFNLLGLLVFIALIICKAEIFNFVFVLVYLSNITIGIVQEIRAKRCIDKLSIIATKKVTVIRDNKTDEILPENIVLDDVILLSSGQQIPTDCIILDGETEINESLLTGESVPIKKKNNDQLLSGSFIVSGKCYAIAEHVGKDNYAQKISAQAKKYKKPHSEIMESLKLLIKIIGSVIVPIAIAFILKSYVIQKADLFDSLKRTSALVIGMIPSGMFLLTSLALAIGIIKLAKHNTLVQDLYSLEMLARVDTICFDKTGTITDGNMTVKAIKVLCDNLSETEVNQTISSLLFAVKDENHTALALKEFFGTDEFFISKYALPFNSERKFSAVTFQNGSTFALGAPEFVLNKEQYQSVIKIVEKSATQGYRILILAKSLAEISDNVIPNDFKPVALILLMDNIRENAVSTVKWFKENGVKVKVISGDNPITVAEVSKRVGIENAEKFISLEGLSHKEVASAANEYTVFGRVTPDQKAILVKSMKANGHVTAMTGDGVNDVLALKEADCAITIASGSDAARNVAHLVLLDDNFDSLPNIVFEGRRVINNIQRSASLYLMKTFFIMILSVLTLILPYIKVYPFDLRQMNLLEILVIGIPSFFLSLQPNKDKVEGKFLKTIIMRSLPGAFLMIFSVAVIEILKLTLGYFDEEVYRTLGVYAFTFAGTVNLLLICKPFNKYRAVLFSTCFGLILITFLITVFGGIPMLGLVKLSPLSIYYSHILFLLGIILIDIIIALLIQATVEKKKRLKNLI